MTVGDRPALGAILERLDVQRRRRERRGQAAVSIDEYTARVRTLARLVAIHEEMRAGNVPWRRVADDLRRLADAIERVPSRLLERELERDRAA